MSWKDRAIAVSTTPTKSSWKDRAVPVETKEELPDYSNQEVSQPEAFGVGAIQGSTLGTAPIASGVGGFLANAAEQIGDKLGLTTDSQLAEGIDTDDLPGLTPELRAKLSEKTAAFTMPEKKTGLDALMSEYYDSRERMKGWHDAASDQHPWTTLAGNVAPMVATSVAAPFLAARQAPALVSNIANSGSKILPQFDSFTKATKIGAKIYAGAREGAKAGALTGFGSGDAKLAEGEVYDTFRDTLDSAVGGAVVGGAIPTAIGMTKGLGGVVADLPIARQLATSFKGGSKGINLDPDSADTAIKNYSADLLENIRTQFKNAGLSKANALDYADEVGVRVDAGEAFETVMDDVISRKALGEGSRTGKEAILKLFRELKDGPANKIADRLDVNRAKQIQKMEAKGLTLLDEKQVKGNVLDYVPKSGSDKKLDLTKQTFQKLGEDGAEGKLVTKLVQQAGDNQIPADTVDINNLSIRDIRDLMNELNLHTGDFKGGPVGMKEEAARALAAQLKTLRDSALEKAGADASGNKILHKTFTALDRAGIDDNVLTDVQIRKDAMVDKLRNTVTAGNPIDRQRMFQYLEESSPAGYKGFKEGAAFLKDFSDIARSVKPTSGVSKDPTAQLGGTKGLLLTSSNKAGAFSKTLTDMLDSPTQKLEQIAQKMGLSQSGATRQYAQSLLKASQLSDKKRTAAIYSLYQQPEFRKAYQSMGEGLNDIILPVGTDREDKN